MTSAYSGLFKNISFIRFPVSSLRNVPMLGFKKSISFKQLSQIVSSCPKPNIFANLLKSWISSSIPVTSSGRLGNPILEKRKDYYNSFSFQIVDLLMEKAVPVQRNCRTRTKDLGLIPSHSCMVVCFFPSFSSMTVAMPSTAPDVKSCVEKDSSSISDS